MLPQNSPTEMYQFRRADMHDPRQEWRCLSVISFRILAATVSLSLGACHNIPAPSNQANDAVELQTVIDKVKEALSDAQSSLAKYNFEVSKVTVSLQVLTQKNGEFDVKYLVLSGGGTAETDATRQIDITLSDIPLSEKKYGAGSVKEDLAKMIVDAGLATEHVADPPLKLYLASVDLQLGFTVKISAKEGVVLSAIPIGPSLTLTQAGSRVQTLKVTLIRKIQ